MKVGAAVGLSVTGEWDGPPNPVRASVGVSVGAVTDGNAVGDVNDGDAVGDVEWIVAVACACLFIVVAAFRKIGDLTGKWPDVTTPADEDSPVTL